MKYLKKFNEELKSFTYRNAAKKLKDLHEKNPRLGNAVNARNRAGELEKHASDMDFRQQIKQWEKFSEFSKYGEYNVIVNAPYVGDRKFSCYVMLIPEMYITIESWDDEDPDNREIAIPFCLCLIPKTVEDIIEMKKFNGDFYNGFFLSMWITPTYSVVNSEVSFKGVIIDDHDSHPKHQFADRKTAFSIRRLLLKMFTKTEDYPSGYNDHPNTYDFIEQKLIQDLDISSTYGIDMERIREDISSLPVMMFYKQ